MNYLSLLPLFESYEADGFQDIWLEGLERNQVIAILKTASRIITKSSNLPSIQNGIHKCQFSINELLAEETLLDVTLDFDSITISGQSMSEVTLRLEDEALAIDFQPGASEWPELRIIAFLKLLKYLALGIENLRLTWAHEGCRHSPDIDFTELLRNAYNRIEPEFMIHDEAMF